MRAASADGERHFYARIALYVALDTVVLLSLWQIIAMYALFPNAIYVWQRVFFTFNVSRKGCSPLKSSYTYERAADFVYCSYSYYPPCFGLP